jgi:hypothetical protein
LNNFVIVNYHQYMNYFYIQDDLKLTPKLTVNVGIRYELATPQFVTGNHLANFDPTTNSLIQASSGSLYSRALVHTPKLDFAPRFGFAYQADNKTVLRGGYGLMYDQFNREGGENLLAYNGPYIVNSSITQTPTNPICAADASNVNCFRPTQLGYSDNFVSSANFSTALSETRYIPKNIPTGYVQAWHLGVQREVAPNTVLDVSYIGEHGVKIWVLADLNQAAPNVESATCSSTVTTGCVPLLNRRPVAGFTGIEESIPAGFLSYNGFQVKLEHRYSAGLYLLNSFTYSRAIDNASGHLDTPNNDNSRVNLANLNGERGESAYDQPLNDTLTLIWDLPYGRGRQFGSNSNRLMESALGGWQVSFINTATSGQPVNLIYSEPTQFDVSDLLNYRPNVSGNPITPQGQRIKTKTLRLSRALRSMGGSLGGSCFWMRWSWSFPGLSYRRWSSRTTRRRATAVVLSGFRSCCGPTSCSSGSTCRTPASKRRFTSRRRCGGSLAWTWAWLRHRMKRPCCASATCWKSTTWAARCWTR